MLMAVIQNMIELTSNTLAFIENMYVIHKVG